MQIKQVPLRLVLENIKYKSFDQVITDKKYVKWFKGNFDSGKSVNIKAFKKYIIFHN